MSSLAQEVAAELEHAGAKGWQRMIIIIAANALGILLGGGVLGFCAIVWEKSNATDQVQLDLQNIVQTNAAVRAALLDEVAEMRAMQGKLHGDAHFGDHPEGPTAAEVEAAKEIIQQRVDKAIYREQQRGPSLKK